MWETPVQFLDLEDPLEKDMTIHSSTLAWRIPMDRGAWRATVHTVAKSQTQLSTGHTHSRGFLEYYFRKESKVYFAQPSTNTQSSLKQ